MALDRQSIEKKDFPIARRGYDPEAVDAHLGRLAAEVESLQAEVAASGSGAPAAAPPRSSPASLAVAASEQVRTIVEAAESSAAEIEEGARVEAERIRAEAQADAQRTREDAVARSQDHVGAVGEASASMLQRVGAMEGEIGTLIESLRTGANRLGADLSLLSGNMGELYDAAGGNAAAAAPAPVESLPLPPRAAEAAAEPVDATEPDDGEEDEDVRSLPPIPEEAPDPSPHPEAPVIPPGLFTATEPVPPAEDRSGSVLDEPYEADAPAAESSSSRGAGGGDADIDGARLIALNMALNGASREETDAYLRDNFDLPDRGALVDEAFATVEG